MKTQTVVQVAADQTTAPVAAKQTAFSALFDNAAVADAIANAQVTVQTEAPKAKQARATKSASKPAIKPAKPFASPIAYVVRGDGARKLFAHTAAWLELTGLIHGKSAPESLVRALGGSALTYHEKQGNFSTSQGMVSLTAKGMDKFLARQQGGHGSYAQEDMEHYMLMMMEGINDDRLVKSPTAIVPAAKYLG